MWLEEDLKLQKNSELGVDCILPFVENENIGWLSMKYKADKQDQLSMWEKWVQHNFTAYILPKN